MRPLLALLRRNADFRRLFLAALISYCGDWFALVAVSGLVAELTGRESSTALVFAAEVLPLFLLSPLAGSLADRMSRKTLLIGSDVARIVPALGLLVAAATGTAWVAYACVLGISALAAFFAPVAPSVVPNLVDDEDLPTANAALGGLWGAMLFVGAALGGLVAGIFGREVSFVLNAASFAVSALLLVRIKRPFNAERPVGVDGVTVLSHLREVWAFARERKAVRALMLTKAGVGVGNGIIGLLPVLAVTTFHTGDAGIGLLLAMRGLGALVGPFVGRRFATRSLRSLVLSAGSAIVAYAVCYLLLPFAPSLAVAAVVVFLAHLGGGYQWVASTLGLQQAAPDGIRGRVMSLDFALVTLSIGVSALVGGALAEALSLRVAVGVLAGCSLLYGVSWLTWTRDVWRRPASGGDGEDLVVGEEQVQAGTDAG